MIVPMKKAILIVLDREREASLRELGKLGLLHIDAASRESGDWETASRNHDLVIRAHSIVTADKKKQKKAAKVARAAARHGAAQTSLDVAFQAAQNIVRLDEEIGGLKTEAEHLRAELARCAVWGTIEPEKFRALDGQGVSVVLTELTKKEYAALVSDAQAFVLKKHKGALLTALVSFETAAATPGKVFKMPEAGTRELERRLAGKRRLITEKQQELDTHLKHSAALAKARTQLADSIRFAEVRHGMDVAGEVAYVSGFVPETRVDALKEAAKTHGWGLAIDDPAPEDDVPTLLKNSAPVRIIKPVLDFLGTVPGYREVDISVLFLVFFSIFYGMLVGDAGYGCLFLAFTILGRIFIRKMNAQMFGLLLVTSLATILWGAVTNTWFSMKAIADSPFVRWAFIPALAADNTKFLMFVCFVIGLTHLTIAHVISFFRNLKTWKMFSEIGRIAILWGIFYLILNLVLQEPLAPVAIYLILGGLGMVVVFEQQQPGNNFFKGIGLGLANIFLTFLSVASTFADIVSYVRLFAVSLAGAKIAETFNGMAASISGGIPVAGIFLAALVLFFGHALNMALSLIGVLVHGVRLNILEFSGHLGMEWAGHLYTPFTYKENALSGKEKS